MRSNLSFAFLPLLNPERYSNSFVPRRAEPSLPLLATYKDRANNGDTENSLTTRRNIIFSAILLSQSVLLNFPANSISPKEAESSYDKYASTYDALDGGSVANSLGIEEARAAMLQMAQGRVLEVGVGTGLNLGKYSFAPSPDALDGVTSLTLLDVSDGMMAEAKEKVNSLHLPSHIEVEFVKADATKDLIPLFGKGYFDTVVDTFSLCVMGNNGAKRCLEQMQSVVKRESGRVMLIENTRSSNAALGFYQDITADAAAKFGGKGCVSNQNVREYIKNTKGLKLLAQKEFAAGLFTEFICKSV